MGKLIKDLKRLSLTLIKGWCVVFTIFLIGASIPGYFKFVDFYNAELSGLQYPIVKVSSVFLILILTVFIFAILCLKLILNKVNFKLMIVAFLYSTVLTLGFIGFAFAAEEIDFLNIVFVILLSIISFILGIASILPIIKKVYTKEINQNITF